MPDRRDGGRGGEAGGSRHSRTYLESVQDRPSAGRCFQQKSFTRAWGGDLVAWVVPNDVAYSFHKTSSPTFTKSKKGLLRNFQLGPSACYTRKVR